MAWYHEERTGFEPAREENPLAGFRVPVPYQAGPPF